MCLRPLIPVPEIDGDREFSYVDLSAVLFIGLAYS